MLSRTAEYALRAVVVIAKETQSPFVLARTIAEAGHIPDKYLSKVLRDLVRVGVLASTRGIGGGFRLRRPANMLRLIDIIQPLGEEMPGHRCPFGEVNCTRQTRCGIHEQWLAMAKSARELLEKSTIADVIATQQSELPS